MPEGGVMMGSLSKKCNARAKRNQRQQKCYPLEPVLEDSVACLDEAPRKEPQHEKCILIRLRDWYVRLMNEMATSADLTGVSAMYGCSTGQVDYPSSVAMAFARSAKEEEEMAAVQLAASPHHKSIQHKLPSLCQV
ncbi:hypothetical protein KC19_3G261300 [Ceratodon purpureus]|uniref:Uncharacterized protein n=1 Tax=Ceratodon purpureus TaxID=3225 RepID=A0A8T0IRW3_CERPU|nr:hypothetical protein KC19_3G261300 [Ceratodon purpureus]